MIQLRELGPNDACFCGSGRKLKKCCKKRGYWVGPNMVVTSNIRRAAGGMELLSVAAESGTKVTPVMELIDIYRALPAEYRAAALLDAYSITLPARIYEEKNLILGRIDYAWFLYAQTIPYVSSVHDPQGMTLASLQLAAETASKWLWNECGRDGNPPNFATVENMYIAMSVDADFDIYMKSAETISTLFDPDNRAKPMVMWILGRIVHRAFGNLFREAPVGADSKDCACDMCRTRPHPKTCNCLYCSNLDVITRGVIITRNDPIAGRPVSAAPGPFGIRLGTTAEAQIANQALDALGRTLVIYNPEAAQERLHEAHEATLIGDTQRARVLLNQLRAETDDAIETLKPYADRTYGEGAQVVELITRFESLRKRLVSLTAKVEELEKMP